MGKKLSQVKRFSDEKKWEDEVEWFSFPDERMVLVRIVGDVEVLARHWIRTLSGKMFPSWCPRMNEDEEFDHTRPCPAHADFEDKSQKMIIANAIIRQMQERGDPNPVKGIMLPHVVNDDLAQIAELIKEDPADMEKGVDLAIKYSSKAVGNKKWSVQRGDSTPLTEQERKYKFYDLPRIVPQFADPEVAGLYARNMKEAMARHKYYVVPEGNVPQNARDPFKYFRGDARGQPWTDFPVLVDHRNAEKGDSAGTYRVSGGNDARRAPARQEPMYRDDERPAAARASGGAAADHRGNGNTAAENTDEPGDVGADRKGADRSADAERGQEGSAEHAGDGGAHPDGIATMQHPKHGTVPQCFGAYSGIAACSRCPSRAGCIDATDDEDM